MLLSTQIEERRKELLESMGRGTDKFEAYLSAVEKSGIYDCSNYDCLTLWQLMNKGEEDFDSTPTDSVVK